MVLTRRLFALGTLTFGTLACPAMFRNAYAGTHVWQGRAFGSTWRYVGAEPLTSEALTGIEDIVAEVDEQMSPYRDSSDLSRFNAHHGDGWQAMPSALCNVAGRALEIARFTAGAFDPTVGPAVNRFGFGPIQGANGRFEDILVEGDALAKRDVALTLDLCGLAKGYALDRIMQALLLHGAGDFLLELGGEVRTQGCHPSGRDWRIAIEDPTVDAVGVQFILVPRGQALATSGHHANGLSGPIPTSHIINPRIQRPVAQFAASVSVLADTAMQADALATALTAMGPQGPDFAERQGISALFIVAQSSPQTHITTGTFATHILT